MLYTLLLLLASSSSSLGTDITLSSANDFANFVNEVNSGTNYSGTTVYLGSDITLTGSVNPIGPNGTYQFLGVFDGQGYTINNLKISSSLIYTGLFGYSKGLTIKNVVLDSSCSITSSYSGSSTAYAGGIIGECRANSGQCNIENIVNMADVTFSGNISNDKNMPLGGIVGSLSFYKYRAYVKNCVNYGSVTNSGTVSRFAYLGGIVGASSGSSYVQNCLNYGTITHKGTSGTIYIGGIAGYSQTAYTENCVSAGKIVTNKERIYIGSIAGGASQGTPINYCYYTSDANASKSYGYGSPSSTTGTPDTPTDVNSELVSKLNSNATSCNWNKWFLNADNATVTFKMSDNKELSFSSQIILTQNPVKEGNSFLFWCKDAKCTKEFNPEAESISGNTALYAKWTPNNYIVTFDFDNGTTVNETFTYNTEITYPEKEGYTLSWDNYHELMPAKDITVTAHWTPNNYNVTFNVDGGNSLPDDEATKTVTFNEKYGDLPKPNRTGYMFSGWFDENNKLTTNETIVTTTQNHTLYAHWTEITKWVEIIFNTKDLTEEEAKEIIKRYTNTNFTIVKFEKSSESDELTVITKFTNNEGAVNFVEIIKSGGGDAIIKRVRFVLGVVESFSLKLYPLSFLSALFL